VRPSDDHAPATAVRPARIRGPDRPRNEPRRPSGGGRAAAGVIECTARDGFERRFRGI